MDENNLTVPYVALESERARQEKGRKHERTLWFIVVIVLLLLLFGTNAAWINYESQFTDEIVTVEQESESGYNNYVGNDGDIIN